MTALLESINDQTHNLLWRNSQILHWGSSIIIIRIIRILCAKQKQILIPEIYTRRDTL